MIAPDIAVTLVPPLARSESLPAASAKAQAQPRPAPETVKNALRLYDGSKMVTVDPISLRTVLSQEESAQLDRNGETPAQRPGSQQFRRFEGDLADTLIARTPMLRPLKGQPGVFVNPEGKAVVTRHSDVYNGMLATLRGLADADTKARAESGHVKTALKMAGTFGGGGTAVGLIAIGAGAAAGPVGIGAVAVAAGAAAATVIYLNTKDSVGHLAFEQRVNNLIKFGKIDAAENMSQRIGHYFDNSCLRTVALCVTGSAEDTLEVYEKLANPPAESAAKIPAQLTAS